MARPHIEPYVELNNSYKNFSLPGFAGGSHYKVLSLDKDLPSKCNLTVDTRESQE